MGAKIYKSLHDAAGPMNAVNYGKDQEKKLKT